MRLWLYELTSGVVGSSGAVEVSGVAETSGAVDRGSGMTASSDVMGESIAVVDRCADAEGRDAVVSSDNACGSDTDFCGSGTDFCGSGTARISVSEIVDSFRYFLHHLYKRDSATPVSRDNAPTVVSFILATKDLLVSIE